MGTWAAEKPERRRLAEVQRLIADDAAFSRLVDLHLIEVDGDHATVLRPKLIDAFNEIRAYGISLDKLIDLHELIWVRLFWSDVHAAVGILALR